MHTSVLFPLSPSLIVHLSSLTCIHLHVDVASPSHVSLWFVQSPIYRKFLCCDPSVWDVVCSHPTENQGQIVSRLVNSMGSRRFTGYIDHMDHMHPFSSALLDFYTASRLIAGGFHSQWGTPLSLDGLFHGTSINWWWIFRATLWWTNIAMENHHF